MDSQWDFPLVTSIYGEQYYDGFIPELIVVGVTWGGGEVLRFRDYAPSDGADKFLDFMKTELFAFIERNYRAESDNRTLMGCSLGGLLTLYTLFTHTDMFTGYAAASPALGWNNGALLKQEEAFSKKQNAKPVRVFMTVGEVETDRDYFERFAETMKNRNYKNMRLQSKVLTNTGHSGTKSETYSRGLQFVFERNQLKLSDAALNKFAGTYRFANDNNEVEIKNENGILKLHFPQGVVPLFANTENDFYATSAFFNVHFNVTNNTVEGFDLATYERTATLKKVK